MAFLPLVRSIVYVPDGDGAELPIPPVALSLHDALALAAAASRLGLSEQMLRRALALRELAHFRIDGRICINEGDLGGYYTRRFRAEP
jgi:hypothetical protein